MPGWSRTAPDTSTTRERLIAAAIEVFAEQGYEGARLQDIARAAGLTTGAVYANYRGKAELLFDAIGARAGVELDGLLHGHARASVRAPCSSASATGCPSHAPPSRRCSSTRSPPRGATTTSRRCSASVSDDASRCSPSVIARAKHDGSVTDAVSTEAFARFCTMLATGALVLRSLGIEQPDPDDWHALDRAPARRPCTCARTDGHAIGGDHE